LAQFNDRQTELLDRVFDKVTSVSGPIIDAIGHHCHDFKKLWTKLVELQGPIVINLFQTAGSTGNWGQ
jgi:hypothetical protein